MATSARSWPDIAIPPGELLAETLETLGLSQAELARRTRRPAQAINEIIRGTKEVTPETALQFERVLGVPAHVWTRLEADYRHTRARLEDQARLKSERRWRPAIPTLAWPPTAGSGGHATRWRSSRSCCGSSGSSLFSRFRPSKLRLSVDLGRSTLRPKPSPPGSARDSVRGRRSPSPNSVLNGFGPHFRRSAVSHDVRRRNSSRVCTSSSPTLAWRWSCYLIYPGQALMASLVG